MKYKDDTPYFQEMLFESFPPPVPTSCFDMLFEMHFKKCSLNKKLEQGVESCFRKLVLWVFEIYSKIRQTIYHLKWIGWLFLEIYRNYGFIYVLVETIHSRSD